MGQALTPNPDPKPNPNSSPIPSPNPDPSGCQVRVRPQRADLLRASTPFYLPLDLHADLADLRADLRGEIAISISRLPQMQVSAEGCFVRLANTAPSVRAQRVAASL